MIGASPSLRRWWIVLMLAAAGRACALIDGTGKEKEPAPADAPSFEAAVQPLLRAKCWRCHGEESRKGELDLRTPAGILKGGESGAVIVAGRPDQSLLYEKVHKGEMPPKKKDPLTKLEVSSIRKWIESGASFGGNAILPDVTQHDIVPILLLRCAVCHGARKQEGKLNVRSRTALLRGGKSGPALVPGKPEESLMLKRVQVEQCPPRLRLIEAAVKPMETDEVSKLARWIALGAPEVPDEPDVAGTPADPLVRPEDREFWSFRSPQPVTVPIAIESASLLRRPLPLLPRKEERAAVRRATKGSGSAPHPNPLPASQGEGEEPHPSTESTPHLKRIHNPIDAFVLEKLEEKGLSLSPQADRLTLLRRAAFDLTGLPPEPSEVEAFLADESPDAYNKLIDRLLASPRYGERWGRHWLDVAGYADCEGRREQHLPRPFAWRYRDYVIRSFNADKPYDRFLLEQLAGDELADYEHAPEITQEMEDNLVATGFLRMAPDPTWANLTGFVPDRLEVMADAMDVLGSGVMGLTFKCARCHTHKFDPIPQRDYYRLLAVFKGAYDEHDWLKPETNSFGGAFSAGAGERYLPHVTTAERERWQELNARIQQEVDALKAGPQTTNTDKQIKEIEARRQPEPRIMALWDRGESSQTFLYRRGNYMNAGLPVRAGVPAVLTDGEEPFEFKPPWPDAKSTGRRLAFARWLTQPNHPLTARVMVNRIWKHHFGHGLVRSLGNFGKMGDKPTHPELLDWLAREFVRQGWGLKAMHRLMMTSSTYRQASAVTPQQEQLDPGNRFLSRMPMRRMEAEELRDSLLWVTGQLDETRFGPAEPVKVQSSGLVLSGKRRSVYIQQLRKHPASLLESFDLPAMNPNCLQRSESLVAPQALYLLNDTTVRELAGQFAERVLEIAGNESSQQIQRIYWIALSRPPSAEEHKDCLQTLMGLTEQWTKGSAIQANGASGAGPTSTKSEAARKALTTLCHTVMNSAGFLYID